MLSHAFVFKGDDAGYKSKQQWKGKTGDIFGCSATSQQAEKQAEKAFYCCGQNGNSHTARFHPTSAVTVAAL